MAIRDFAEYVPNPIIVARAVELWKRALERPVYDNGGTDFSNAMCSVMASGLPSNAGDKNVMQAFCQSLAKWLTTKSRYDSGSSGIVVSDAGHFQTGLYVDYGPDHVLSQAAEEAGLKMEFPWKSSMRLSAECVSCSFGYGAEYVYHYPLDSAGSRWLVTTLCGSDIVKIIERINAGDDLGLTIDPGSPAP